jgi:hypothetical protein
MDLMEENIVKPAKTKKHDSRFHGQLDERYENPLTKLNSSQMICKR